MEDGIKDQFLHAFFRFKSVDASMHPIMAKMAGTKDMSISEFGLLNSIRDNSTSDSERNVYMSDMPRTLFISKGAISQSLSSLHTKGYIHREANHRNRRQQIITLTDKGIEKLSKADMSMSQLNDLIVEKMGEDDVKSLIVLFNKFADVLEDIKTELQEERSTQ
ncbi:MAG: winged helix DNA-binding protein [Eubacteriaceae bacterium]|nr:winged helix DNA-binding protein [Eubacteriaceae bacterium]